MEMKLMATLQPLAEARLREIDAERETLLEAFPLLRKEKREATTETPQATSDDRPRRRVVWSDARRKAQSRRMKKLHRAGHFKR